MQKLPLSLVVITKNEELNIERCVASVPFASEVVILDSFSTDRTQELAEKMGAKFYQEAWRGYGPQKRHATTLASYDWVLNLDADEALSPKLQDEIFENFVNLDPQKAYEFSRYSFHLGRWIRFGGWHPDWQLRLFHRSYHQWPDTQIHERVESQNKVRMKHAILHWVFKDLSHQVVTNDKYSSLQAVDLFKKAKAFSLYYLLVKPPTKFIELYFFKRGFLDGMAGFVIAVSAAYSVFLKWAKLWELSRVKPIFSDQAKRWPQSEQRSKHD